jgi:phage minor structural protein
VVSVEELQVFDKNLKRTGYLVHADQVERKRRINSDYELTFLVPMNSEDYQKIQLKGHVKDERGQFYVINSRQRDRTDARRMAKIHCMHVMFKLADFKFPYSSYIEEAYGVNISTLTDLISSATGGKFTFSIDDSFDLKDVKDFGRGNCLQALNDIIKLYECEIEPDNFVIHIKKKIGDQNSELQYRLKKNIISDSFMDDTRALVTRMYSQMKDGLTFIGLDASNLTSEEYDLLSAIPGAIVNGKLAVNYLISPYWETWANDTNTFYDGEIILQDIEDPVELLEATRKALRENEVPQLDINVKAADLFKIDHTEPKPNLGDTVLLIDSGMEMNSIEARIIEITEYPFDKSRHSEVKLANFMKRDFEDIIADLDRSKRIVDDLISGGRVRVGAFEEFAKRAVIDINNSKTEVKYDQRGIVLESKINPAHQVIHSSVGTILTTDGGQTARVAITAEGIAAPYIVGVLGEFAQVRANQIIVGPAGEKIGDDLINSAATWNGKTTLLTPTGIYTGTIQANQINTTSLSAISANLGTVTAGHIQGITINGALIDGTTIIGSTIMTAGPGVYPRIELNSNNNILKADTSAGYGIGLYAALTGQASLVFDFPTGAIASMSALATEFLIATTLNRNISIGASGDLNLYSFGTGRVRFTSWSQIYSNSAGRTLQDELNALWLAIASL